MIFSPLFSFPKPSFLSWLYAIPASLCIYPLGKLCNQGCISGSFVTTAVHISRYEICLQYIIYMQNMRCKEQRNQDSVALVLDSLWLSSSFATLQCSSAFQFCGFNLYSILASQVVWFTSSLTLGCNTEAVTCPTRNSSLEKLWVCVKQKQGWELNHLQMCRLFYILFPTLSYIGGSNIERAVLSQASVVVLFFPSFRSKASESSPLQL